MHTQSVIGFNAVNHDTHIEAKMHARTLQKQGAQQQTNYHQHQHQHHHCHRRSYHFNNGSSSGNKHKIATTNTNNWHWSLVFLSGTHDPRCGEKVLGGNSGKNQPSACTKSGATIAILCYNQSHVWEGCGVGGGGGGGEGRWVVVVVGGGGEAGIQGY